MVRMTEISSILFRYVDRFARQYVCMFVGALGRALCMWEVPEVSKKCDSSGLHTTVTDRSLSEPMSSEIINQGGRNTDIVANLAFHSCHRELKDVLSSQQYCDDHCTNIK